jgi:hypothetical protein
MLGEKGTDSKRLYFEEKKHAELILFNTGIKKLPGHIGLLKYCTLLVLPAHASTSSMRTMERHKNFSTWHQSEF